MSGKGGCESGQLTGNILLRVGQDKRKEASSPKASTPGRHGRAAPAAKKGALVALPSPKSESSRSKEQSYIREDKVEKEERAMTPPRSRKATSSEPASPTASDVESGDVDTSGGESPQMKPAKFNRGCCSVRHCVCFGHDCCSGFSSTIVLIVSAIWWGLILTWGPVSLGAYASLYWHVHNEAWSELLAFMFAGFQGAVAIHLMLVTCFFPEDGRSRTNGAAWALFMFSVVSCISGGIYTMRTDGMIAYEIADLAADVPDSTRIAIVGGGNAATSAAWMLQSAGIEYELYEEGAYLGASASLSKFLDNSWTTAKNDTWVDTGFAYIDGQGGASTKTLLGLYGLNLVVANHSVASRGASWKKQGGCVNHAAALKSFETKAAEFTRALSSLLSMELWLSLNAFTAEFTDECLYPTLSQIFLSKAAMMKSSALNTIKLYNTWLTTGRTAKSYLVEGSMKTLFEKHEERMNAGKNHLHLNSKVAYKERSATGVTLEITRGASKVKTTEKFTNVIMAQGAASTLAALGATSTMYEDLLMHANLIPYDTSTTVLHRDAAVVGSTLRSQKKALNYEQSATVKHNLTVDYGSMLGNALPGYPTTTIYGSRDPAYSHIPGEQSRTVWTSVRREFVQTFNMLFGLPWLQGIESTWFVGDWTHFLGVEEEVVQGIRVACAVGNLKKRSNSMLNASLVGGNRTWGCHNVSLVEGGAEVQICTEKDAYNKLLEVCKSGETDTANNRLGSLLNETMPHIAVLIVAIIVALLFFLCCCWVCVAACVAGNPKSKDVQIKSRSKTFAFTIPRKKTSCGCLCWNWFQWIRKFACGKGKCGKCCPLLRDCTWFTNLFFCCNKKPKPASDDEEGLNGTSMLDPEDPNKEANPVQP